MKKLGIIGGMGPESTVDYYLRITQGICERMGGSFFPDLTIESKSCFEVVRFADEGMESVGAGRRSRFEYLDELRNVRVVGDVSSVEVFVNDGELTFSSRYYPNDYTVTVDAPTATVHLWDLVVGE